MDFRTATEQLDYTDELTRESDILDAAGKHTAARMWRSFAAFKRREVVEWMDSLVVELTGSHAAEPEGEPMAALEGSSPNLVGLTA